VAAPGAPAWKDGREITPRDHGQHPHHAPQEDRGGFAEQLPQSGRPTRAPVDPLSAEPVPSTADKSIGALVSEATKHVSTLVRAEVELARTEITAEVKKGLQGSVFFIIALTVVLFSLFFLFFFLAELLALWVGRPGGFAIVFGLMLLTAGLFGFIGYRRVRKIRKPERTISTLKESAAVLAHRGRDGAEPTRPELDRASR
jgi:hypothetical protein